MSQIVHRGRRRAIMLLPLAWLGLFFLVPFAMVVMISLAEPTSGIPPYIGPIIWGENGLEFRFRFDSYKMLVEDSYYIDAFLQSVRIAGVSALICLVLGYPMAYAIARAQPTQRLVLLTLIVLPFWTSFLIRVYAWMGILGTTGHLNNLLIALGVIDQPLALLYSEFAVHLGIVYSYLPFAILPIYAVLERQDEALLDAAADLGCRPFAAFLRVTLPMSIPGVVAAALLVFVPALGEYVIPELLGASDTQLIGRLLWSEFFGSRDWPLASAIVVVLLAVVIVPIHVLARPAGAAGGGA
ncbi:MAG: ABC transporter permease subunit [Alphaproteobacteria bacterium]